MQQGAALHVDLHCSLMIPDDFRATLQELLLGLWFPSETDSPWVLLESWDLRRAPLPKGEESPDPPLLTQATPRQELSPEEFLAQVEWRSRGYGQAGREMLQRHRALVQVLRDRCDGLRVIRLGEGRVEVFLIAEGKGQFWVLQTHSIET